MKQKISRLLCGALALLVLVSVMALGASADEVLDLNRKSNLNMVLEAKNKEGKMEPIVGAEVSLYRIALTRHVDWNQVYIPTAQFVGAKINLKDIKDEADLLQKVPTAALVDHINKYHLPGYKTAVSGSDGKVSFTGLSAGLYMVRMTKQDAGKHNFKEFLVTLPRLNADGSYDYEGKTIFRPKTEIIQEFMDIKVVKIWKGDKPADRPKSITVELVGNGQVNDTAVLNPANNWTHLFTDKPAGVEWKVQEKVVPKEYKSEVGKMTLVNGVYTITITNTKRPPLIQTGQLNWPVPFMVMGGLTLIVLGYVLTRDKKKVQD